MIPWTARRLRRRHIGPAIPAIERQDSLNRRTRALLLCAVALLVGATLVPSGVSAHSGKQSYLYLTILDDGIEGRIEYPVSDLAAATGIEIPSNPERALRVAEDSLEQFQQYSQEHLDLGDGSANWTIEFEGVDVLPAAGTYLQFPFRVTESFDTAPREFVVVFDAIIHAVPEKDSLLIIENDWGTATFDNESDYLLSFSQGQTTQTVSLQDVSALESMRSVRGLGTDAVRLGIDHVLFVIALVLPAGLVAVGRSVKEPAPTVNAAVRRVAGLLGVFVLAHSTTLWLQGLGVTDVPDRLVGSLVAASLLVMALFAAWRFTRREHLVVAVLGLAQGLGFGMLFVDDRLDRSRPVLSLIAYNVGIEIAVLIITGLVFPVLLLLRRTAAAPFVLYGGSIVLSAYGAAWLLERVSDSDLAIERMANPVRVWPRNLWLMLLVIAASGGFYWWTRSRSRLKPLVSDDEPTDRRVENPDAEPASVAR